MTVDWLIRKQREEQLKTKFYLEFVPELIGRRFHMPRGYGHAGYVIHGGPETWRLGRDRHKALISLAGDHPELCNHGGNDVVAIVIERLGGYNGPCTLPTLQEVIAEFKVEEVQNG